MEDEDLIQDDQPDTQDAPETAQDDAPAGSMSAEILDRLDTIGAAYARLEARLTADDQNRFKQAAAGVEARMRQAAETGDLAAFDQAKKDLDQINTAMQQAASQPSYTEDPNFKAFKKRNPWYGVDEEMTIEADLRGEILSKTKGLSGAALYSATEKHMRKVYPHLFENPNRTRPSPVAETRGAERTARGKGWNDLPADAKATAKKQIAKGLFKDEADYAKEYFSQFEDQAHAA